MIIPMAKIYRCKVNFSEDAYEDLRCRAHVQREMPGDIIARGLALSKLFNDTRRAGGRVLLETRDQGVFEVLDR